MTPLRIWSADPEIDAVFVLTDLDTMYSTRSWPGSGQARRWWKKPLAARYQDIEEMRAQPPALRVVCASLA